MLGVRVRLLPFSTARRFLSQKAKQNFILACWRNDTQEIKQVLDTTQPADLPELLAAKNEHGWSPVFFAVVNNNSPLLQTLLNKGADIHVSNRQGWFPLHYAAGYAHTEMLDILLQHGADIEVKNPKNDWTPLHRAVHWGRREGVLYLLKRAANFEAVDKEQKGVFQLTKINSEEINAILTDYTKNRLSLE